MLFRSDPLRYATPFKLRNDLEIQLITAPYLIATKIEAFHGRGNSDYLASHDLEDILRVIDGRSSIIDEIKNANDNVRRYIVDQFARFLQIEAFLDAIAGHLLPDDFNQSRAEIIERRIRTIANL